MSDVTAVRFVNRVGLVTPFTLTDPTNGVPLLSGTVKVISGADGADFYRNEFGALEKKLNSRARATAHLYARCVTAWDFYSTADATEPMPITPENVALLPTELLNQLDAVIFGLGAQLPKA